MRGDPPERKYLIIWLILWKTVFAQDSLLHPELLSPQAQNEFERGGKTKLKISFGEEIEFKTKAQFTYKGFEFNYQNEGGDEEEIKQRTSLSWFWKGLAIGSGRGQPHIAKGIILGNTMMRFSTALSGQAGVRSAKFKIGAYDQYKNLAYLRYGVGHADLVMLRFADVYAAVAEYVRKNQRYGFAIYSGEKVILETWGGYSTGRIKGSINLSISDWKPNHIIGDILYNQGEFSLFGASVWLGKDFRGIKPDSKWGSGLQAGSRGHAVGASYRISPWKINGVAYVILSMQRTEKRCLTNIRYKKKPFEINLAYNGKAVNELLSDNIFPFSQTRVKEQYHICKLNAKISLDRKLSIVCQFQGDLFHHLSFASVCRISYTGMNNSIKLQVSNCQAIDSELYFLRPLSSSTYSIRKSPKERAIYLDLLCSKKIGDMEIYILLRNEGVNLGMIVDN